MPTVAALDQYLVLPIALDALSVPATGAPAIDPLLDPRWLPYAREENGRVTHVNEGTAYLSENILSQPFNDQNALLEPGIHLHWSLPDLLTRAQSRPGEDGELELTFPAVPNRWLVTRHSSQPGLPNRQWIVYSDFLWPENVAPEQLAARRDGWQLPHIAYHHRSPAGPGEQPFRFLGLVGDFQPGQNPTELPPEGDALLPLTAVGYGDPLFAALYVNCRNIFGLHDPLDGLDPASVPLTRLRYEVVGWYSDPGQDFLQQFVAHYQPEHYGDQPLLEALQLTFQLTLPADQQDELPGRLACHSQITFGQDKAPVVPVVLDQPEPVKLAIGNSATEALSAFLAHHLSDNDEVRQRLENQLESLHMQADTEDQFVDLGPVFEEARHNKTFNPVSGGRLWALRPETAKEAGEVQLRDFYTDLGAAILLLPPAADDWLDRANDLQRQHNQAGAGIEFLERQLFTDWHKYMVSTYHEEGRGDYPDIDEVRLHLERLMDMLQLLRTFRGDIRYDETEKRWAAEPLAALAGLPDPQELLHLLPVNVPAFREWCQWISHEQEKDPPYQDDSLTRSLSAQLAEVLNQIAAGLTGRARLVSGYRRIQALLQDDQRMFTTNDLDNLAESLDDWLGEPVEGLELPVMAARDRYAALKDRLAGQAELLTEAIDLFREMIRPLAALPILSLDATKAPRYWQPNEPVLLLAGAMVETTDRHGQDGEAHPEGWLTGQPAPANFLDQVLQGQSPTPPGPVRTTDGNPWHALLFEWEVRIDELTSKGNRNPATLRYEPDFITHQFRLSETRSEFLIIDEDADTSASRAYFSGRSVLLPYARQQLINEIEQYLIKHAQQYVLDRHSAGESLNREEATLAASGEDDPAYRAAWLDYFHSHRAKLLAYYDRRHHEALVLSYLSAPVRDLDEQDIPPGEKQRRALLPGIDRASLDAAAYWQQNRADILAWYRERFGDGVEDNDPIHTVLEAREALDQLNDRGVHVQAQALSGFNEALLMLRQQYQLEVAEPTGPVDYRAFSARVAAAVGRQNIAAGDPFLDFHPLRTGKMNIQQLRLVDSFGRTFPLIDRADSDGASDVEVYCPERMKSRDGRIALPPRIVQPARINLRWLAAEPGLGEVSTHPLTSPICGWVVPNLLDISLMFYNSRGEALGSLDVTGHWRPFPGREAEAAVGGITNPYLKKLRDWIHAQALRQEGFVEELLDQWERILENIDPAGYSQHAARSLLVGRPMALVQATVDLQLKGWPAVHQDWNHFRRVLASEPYQDDGFPDVEIPIRIGEHWRLSDGVVSFWVDEANGYRDDRMYHPLADLTFQQSIAAPAQRITVLMDPRGLLHCTTGVLPTKAISIPREQYTDALRKIQIAFLSAPVISDPVRINLALPVEAGFTWAWVQRDGRQWTELSERLTLEQPDILAAFPDGADIWERMVANGWIELAEYHDHLAYYVTPQDRTRPTLARPEDDDSTRQAWAQRQEEVQRVIDMLCKGILPPYPEARFSLTQEIREGWLALRPVTGFDDDPLT